MSFKTSDSHIFNFRFEAFVRFVRSDKVFDLFPIELVRIDEMPCKRVHAAVSLLLTIRTLEGIVVSMGDAMTLELGVAREDFATKIARVPARMHL